ncbi:MAG: hypothetical protein IPI05_05505 [Flavobacteriales bacterium]|nr:hypothetical protein [Flavobacteriales bacterium]
MTDLPNGVLVNWTIHGGSTCDGQDVERSTDSVNFVMVHRIQGICGSSESSTPYTWFDPPAGAEQSLLPPQARLRRVQLDQVRVLSTA